MNCQDTTKIQIVLWMLGSPGVCKWQLLQRLLHHYPVEYAGYTREGGWVDDPLIDRDDMTTYWRLALISTLAHFERPEVRAKFFNGMRVGYGFFLTKAVWSLTQMLEGDGAIPMRERKKCPRDENGKRLKAKHKPARHGNHHTISLDRVLQKQLKASSGDGANRFMRGDIAALPDYGDEHNGY